MSQKSTDQLGSLKDGHQKELAKVQQELEALRASLEAKTKEVNEKNTTLLQVGMCLLTWVFEGVVMHCLRILVILACNVSLSNLFILSHTSVIAAAC